VLRHAAARDRGRVRRVPDDPDGSGRPDQHPRPIGRRRDPHPSGGPLARGAPGRHDGDPDPDFAERGRALMTLLETTPARLLRETVLGAPPATRDTGSDGARTVTVRLCRWNLPRAVVDPDGAHYREQYP